MKYVYTLCVLLAVSPWAWFSVLHGIPTVPPEFMDDSVYYYTRMHAVTEGYPFIGNPYFKEHATEMASAFFGADWLAVIPQLLGIPLVPALLVTVVIWTLIFVWGVNALFREWNIPEKYRPWMTFLVYLSQFWMLERPVAMQIVFPAYLFFLYTLSRFARESTQKNAILLGFSSALSFYLYTYLWMVVVVTLGLMHLVVRGSLRERIMHWWVVDVVFGVGALPMVVYTFIQTHHAWYWETAVRLGLVETHTFGSSAVLLALIVCAGLVCIWHVAGTARQILVVTGVALLIVSFSNVITGKDLETAVHFMRFVSLWVALCATLIVSAEGMKWPQLRRIGGGVVFAVLLFQQVHTGQLIASNITSYEDYAPLLLWISVNAKGDVVMADETISKYIPLMTHSFVLFYPAGGFYLMPSQEMEDRYLTSRVLMPLSFDDVVKDMRKYAGAGNAIHAYKTENRHRAFCRLFSHNCLSDTTLIDHQGKAYFDDLVLRHQQVQKNAREALAQFSVRYVVKDETKDTWNPEVIGVREIKRFGSIVLYAL